VRWWWGEGGDLIIPACAAEIGDEVEDPVEAVAEGWGKRLPAVLNGFAGVLLVLGI